MSSAFRSGRAAVLVTLALVGCAPPGAPDASGPPPDRSDWPFAVFPYDPDAPVRETDYQGSLVLQDGCLMLQAEVGDPASDGTLFALHLPDTVDWSDGALTFGSSTYRPGDHIALYGGSVPRAQAEADGLPSSCPDVVVLSVR